MVVTDDDLEKIKTEKERSIQIMHFAQLNQISPIYYDKTYQATPLAGGDKAFELLRAALMSEQRIAIGKTVMGTKETLLAIIPRDEIWNTPYIPDNYTDSNATYSKMRSLKLGETYSLNGVKLHNLYFENMTGGYNISIFMM